MRAPRNHRVRFVLPALLAALCASCGISKNNRYWQTIGAYKVAQPVEAERIAGGNRPSWDLERVLPDGTRVTVTAQWRIAVQYSDEKKERVLLGHTDYVYPQDVRVQGNVLYVYVDGWGAGVWRHTRLIVFDLAKRKKLHELKVEADDLK